MKFFWVSYLTIIQVTIIILNDINAGDLAKNTAVIIVCILDTVITYE